MIQLFPHQEEGLKLLLKHKKFPLFMEQGTGKTAVVIRAIEERFKRGEVEDVLVFAPNSILYNWTLELEKFLTLPKSQVIIETLPQKKREKRLEALEAFYRLDLDYWTLNELRKEGVKGTKRAAVEAQPKKLRILLLNFEKSHTHLKDLLKFKPQMLVVDESHRVKSRSARTSKAIHKLGRDTEYRVLMTGTPIMNGLEDVFMQYKIMDETIFGTSYPQFESRYIRKGGYMGYEIIGYTNQEEFNQIIEDTSYRVEIDDVITLPPLSMRYLTTELEPQSLKVYMEMHGEMLTRVEKASESLNRKKLKEICRMNGIYYEPQEPYYSLLLKAQDFHGLASADLVVTQLIRLQQITGGFITRDDGEVVQVGKEKLTLVKEVLSESKRPALIFCRYVAEIKLLEEELKGTYKVGVYRDPETREQVYKNFQEGKIEVLILQFQSGSVGLNLQRANRLIFYSWSFSSGDYQQAIARIKRNGQKNPMEITHLVAEGTIDEHILKVLDRKKEIADSVFK